MPEKCRKKLNYQPENPDANDLFHYLKIDEFQ